MSTTNNNPTTTPSGTATSSSSTLGDGGRGRRSGGRGRHSNNHGKNNNGNKTTSGPFKGDSPEMNGHVYQCFGEGTGGQTQFMKTTEVLGQYIAKNIKFPGDMTCLTRELKQPEIEKPPALPADADEFDKLEWKGNAEDYIKRKKQLVHNTKAVYAVIWGQCSEALRARLRSTPDFIEKDKAQDCVWILKTIKGIMLRFEGQRFICLSIADASQQILTFRQGPETTLAKYYEDFKNLVEVYQHYGGDLGSAPGLAAAIKEGTKEQKAEKAREMYIGVLFLRGADRKRFGGLWTDLENQHSRGHNQYPENLTDAYALLVNYQNPRKYDQPRSVPVPPPAATPPEITGLSFAQTSITAVPGTDGKLFPNITCNKCTDKGHYANLCPSRGNCSSSQHTRASFQNQHSNHSLTGFSCSQYRVMTHIPDAWILLDSQSTESIFKNKNLLTNIRDSESKLTLTTNGGQITSTQLGNLQYIGPVWYNPESIANILSLAQVRKVLRVSMDTAFEPCLLIHKEDGSVLKFRESESGLYYYDTSSSNDNSTSELLHHANYSFIQTVDEQKSRFHRREIEAADKARQLYNRIGRPSQKHFEDMLKNNAIRNCPVTIDDARRAITIYGEPISILKGRSTQSIPVHVPSPSHVDITQQVVNDHKSVVLSADIFYVQGMMFFHTISRKLKFRTVSPIADRKQPTLLRELQSVCNLYTKRGFELSEIHCDMEFGCLRDDMYPIPLNLTPRDAHVGEVERSIRTIKERVRSDIHDLPFKRLPKLMVAELVRRAIFFLNQCPAVDGVSETMSPFTIVTGQPSLDYNNIKLDFGSYVQVYEPTDPLNSTTARSSGAIVLNHSGNAQGDYYFMSLHTGRRLLRRQWTCLPMPAGVIAAVEHRAELENQPLIKGGCLLFEWTPNHPIVDDSSSDYDPDTTADDDTVVVSNVTGHVFPTFPSPPFSDSTPDPAVVPPHPLNLEDLDVFYSDDTASEEISDLTDDAHSVTPSVLTHPHSFTDAPTVYHDALTSTSTEAVQGAPNIFPHETPDVQGAHTQDSPESHLPTIPETTTTLPETQSPTIPTPTHNYNLRESRTRNYDHLYGSHLLQTVLPNVVNKPAQLQQCITGFILTQMTATAGIRKHGSRAVDALFQELCQLDDKKVFKPINANNLTRGQKREALRAINLIKEKRCGKLKGRTCADGSTQRGKYTKEQTASPTVSPDALMLSLMIDVYEKRDVAIADVVGAYLHALMDDFTVLKLQGDVVDIMCEVNPTYREFVTVENNKKVLYLRLLKALYGCVRSALLWYELFYGTLKELGFELNPYDPCVANKIVDGHQCTIVWYAWMTQKYHMSIRT